MYVFYAYSTVQSCVLLLLCEAFNAVVGRHLFVLVLGSLTLGTSSMADGCWGRDVVVTVLG
jgi:hypothetical protein